MLGSHNTFSYLPTNNLLRKWGRCQEVSYIEQYNQGVRCYDVRVKFSKKGDFEESLTLVHNNIKYKGGWDTLKKFFFFAESMKCSVRLILDVRKKPKDYERQIGLFYNLVYYAQTILSIKVVEAIVYWDWSYIIEPTVRIVEKHASVDNSVDLFRTPKKYSKKHNAQIVEEYSGIVNDDSAILLMDFVNIK